MGQAIIGLARQVPQNRFALDFSVEAEACGELIQHPELLSVGGSMFLEVAVGEPPTQAGFSHPGITQQDNLGRRVMHGQWSSTGQSTEQSIEIQIPNEDHRV